MNKPWYLFLLLLSACGGTHEYCNGIEGGCPVPAVPSESNEMVGVPVRPLEWPVPGRPDLPTPADALTMTGLPGSAAEGMYSAEFQGGVILSSVGFYSRGKIWSYEQLETNDLWTIRNPDRAFANYFIADILRSGFRDFYLAEPTASKMMIWDVSKNGGGTATGHASHQLGLDVDVEYPYLSSAATQGKSERTIDYDKTWSFVKSMVGTGRIQRMFTDNPIKARLCRLAKNDPDLNFAIKTLRALRYWPGHDNHVHLRFYCPPMDKLCVAQDEPPKGSGCSAVGVKLD